MNIPRSADEWYSTLVDVVRSLLDGSPVRRERSLGSITTVQPAPPAIVVGPTTIPRGDREAINSTDCTLIGPEVPIFVEPPARPAWDERGWKQSLESRQVVYDGQYQVRLRGGQLRRFQGRILVNGNSVTAYIADPPPEVRRHPKGPCFQLSKAPWFRIHWWRAARNVDDALLYVERVLDEAFK